MKAGSGERRCGGAHLDLSRAPYVLYGVKYIGLVSLAPINYLVSVFGNPRAEGSYLDLSRAPYGLYGVKYIDLVSHALFAGVSAYASDDNYLVSVFGDPRAGDCSRWGWRYQGYHASLHFNVVCYKGKPVIVSVPTFLGAEPLLRDEEADGVNRIETAAWNFFDALTSQERSEMIQGGNAFSQLQHGTTSKAGPVAGSAGLRCGGSYLDLICAPYVLYGVKYIDLVSLSHFAGTAAYPARRSKTCSLTSLSDSRK